MRAFAMALLMLLLSLVLMLLSACGTTREQAHQATALDATTTAIGVGTGIATEANPLITTPTAFAAIMVARVIGVELANQMGEPVRTQTLTGLNSIWWGVGVSNLLILIAAPTPVGLAAGAMFGAAWWQRTADEREFAAICASERALNPRLTCTYAPSILPHSSTKKPAPRGLFHLHATACK